MPRKTRRSPETRPPAPVRPAWPGYALTALVAAALGAGATWLAVRPARTSPTLAVAPAASAGSAPSPAPPAVLTQGLPPAQAALNLGNWYEDHQQWPQAIAAYTQAMAGGIVNPDIRTDLGVAYYRSGQPRRALEQYQAAHAQDPHHENSLFNQGSAYLALGDATQAVAAWQQYIARFPQGQHVAEARQFIAGTQSPARPSRKARE